MNTAIKGRRLEWKVRDYLKEQGYTVFRCASSKPLDLICFKRDSIDGGLHVRLIDCKCGKYLSVQDKVKAKGFKAILGIDVEFATKGTSKEVPFRFTIV